ncbi:hypothetical protein CDL15_Pgr027066 [Punica granatum]|uniref:DNA-directed RNA polymerase n=1 Tax=Punica granatum TaxID=22663 RepID=A0A218XH62_PUNGR|nr:hypothetical protein CDL15_Pgr027066 [Punica granatum]
MEIAISALLKPICILPLSQMVSKGLSRLELGHVLTEQNISRALCGNPEKAKSIADYFRYEKTEVFLNRDWIGVCEDSLSFITKLRNKRLLKEIPPEVEIKTDEHHGEVHQYSDTGRVLRPLLVDENLKKIALLKGSSVTFQDLLYKGIVEFIGAEEEEDRCTAWGIEYIFREEESKEPVKYSHYELNMSFSLGLSCRIIPFANHDHAKRVPYEEQGIGFLTTNPNIRVDTLSHQLYYPQRPLFRTVISDCFGNQNFYLVVMGQPLSLITSIGTMLLW